MITDKGQNTPLCSVCCLSYNHSKFIESNLKNIWNQDYKNIEIIALDDGSPDNSAEILNRLKDKSPFPMKVITQKNSGNIAKNFNTLLSKASGKYIVFMSCDDKLAEGSIRTKIDLMEKDDNMVFVASKRLYEIDDSDNIIKETAMENLDDKIKKAEDLLGLESEIIGTFYIQSAVFRKEIVDAIKGFDEDLLGDDIVLRTKLFLHMQKHPNLTFKITDDYGFYYRFHGNNIHKNILRQINIVAQVLDRYFPDKKAPAELKAWVGHGLRHLPFNEAIKMFAINQKCSDLMKDEDIQEMLIKNYSSDKYNFFAIYKTKTAKDKSVHLVIFNRVFLLYRKNRC